MLIAFEKVFENMGQQNKPLLSSLFENWCFAYYSLDYNVFFYTAEVKES